MDYYKLANIVLNEISNGIDSDVLKEISDSKNKYLRFLTGLLIEGYKEGIIAYIPNSSTLLTIALHSDSMFSKYSKPVSVIV